MYDVIIIGGGPAGAGAAVYTGRKQLKTLLLTEEFGGQSFVSDRIENWIGDLSISGEELAERLEKHVSAQETVEIQSPKRVTKVEKSNKENELPVWSVHTKQGDVYQATAVIICTGGRRRRLEVPGEDQFEGRGVVYCSTCDAPLFRGRTVAVVGGGNAGLEAVVDLFPYAEKIYLLVRGEELKGDALTQERIADKSNLVEIIYNANTKEIFGEKLVEGLRYEDLSSGELKELEVGGVFVEIGSIPNSEFMEGVVEMNEHNEIIINHKTGETNEPGLFAAGDVTDELYKQNNISTGDAIRAALSAYSYIQKMEKSSPAAEKVHS